MSTYLKFLLGKAVTTCRYMRPCTPHLVVTTTSCVMEGAHFYNFASLRETFAGLVFEHLDGANITNTEHPLAPMLLIKGLDTLYTGLEAKYDRSKESDLAKPVPWGSTLSCFCLDRTTADIALFQSIYPNDTKSGG